MNTLSLLYYILYLIVIFSVVFTALYSYFKIKVDRKRNPPFMKDGDFFYMVNDGSDLEKNVPKIKADLTYITSDTQFMISEDDLLDGADTDNYGAVG